ncbi:xanthine dehydrogenase family protein molybdopterin-binding subunit [Halopseudomonas sp.]|uniref:xanthine dehydrogenase family protein molybdopterin-binding subunit n=1 Tax=Halopseudomonas sp. TaxID=2901191 RepID=UPI00300182D3
MTVKTSPVGKPLDRVDGPLKVQGQAKYAGEFALPNMLYGHIVNATIARGRILQIDSRAAQSVAGIEAILTHENRPPIASYDKPYEDDDAADGSPFRPLFNDRILYNSQPIALVVGESLELARYAASLIKVEYESEDHATDLLANLDQASKAPGDLPDPGGDAQQALHKAAVKVAVQYSTPVEHHNPMEPHASTVHYLPDGSLEVYDKTQGVQNCMRYLEDVFDMQGQIRILTPFVGGAFGSGLRPQHQLPLAVMAALKLKRSVRVTFARQQMFTFGYRPRSIQRLTLGASEDGQLQAIHHQAIAQTSRFEDYTEQQVEWSGMLYKCPNVTLDYQLVPLDVYTPLDMRAPGGTIGVYALECAMDELAYAANIDPVALRQKNFTDFNANEGKPYSSKALLECYEQGAERFGWGKRTMAPRSMRDGHQLIGWGMATGMWEAMQMPASAKACIDATGKLVVSSATTDIGTGTYTVMTQIAAEAMGLAMEQVEFKLGDSSMATAPLQGGSFTVSSVGSAVQKACKELRLKLLDSVQQSPASPFSGKTQDEIDFADGWVFIKAAPEHRVKLTDIAAETGALEVEASVEPGEVRDGYATGTHSAVFVEVKVDEDTGMVAVSRVVSAIAAGRVVNPKTASNQIVGGVVWGVSQALHEETQMDHNLGRFMNHSLAEYHIPVQADIGDIDVIFVEEHDEIVNALGSKGVGEIGIVGVAAAVSNAIFHATGKRVRDLPVTLDKLL